MEHATCQVLINSLLGVTSSKETTTCQVLINLLLGVACLRIICHASRCDKLASWSSGFDPIIGQKCPMPKMLSDPY